MSANRCVSPPLLKNWRHPAFVFLWKLVPTPFFSVISVKTYPSQGSKGAFSQPSCAETMARTVSSSWRHVSIPLRTRVTCERFSLIRGGECACPFILGKSNAAGTPAPANAKLIKGASIRYWVGFSMTRGWLGKTFLILPKILGCLTTASVGR